MKATKQMVERSLEEEIVLRKQIEQELVAKQEELTDFIEQVNVPLHWVAQDGTILWANQAELELLGYSLDEYVGYSITEFHVDPSVIEDIMARLTRNET